MSYTNLRRLVLCLCVVIQTGTILAQPTTVESKKLVKLLKTHKASEVCLKIVRSDSLEQDLELHSRMVTLLKTSSIRCVKPAENQFVVIASFRSVTQPDLIICNARIIGRDGEILSRFNTTVERTFASRKSSLLPK